MDHLIPETAGGPTVAENLWLACRPCNEHKGIFRDRTEADDGDGVHGLDYSVEPPGRDCSRKP
ncbi:MAG: HNH endonuclease [Chloroflexi bacterium]|nr:HNH endonuclease [Chloroflexota bacterium]